MNKREQLIWNFVLVLSIVCLLYTLTNIFVWNGNTWQNPTSKDSTLSFGGYFKQSNDTYNFLKLQNEDDANSQLERNIKELDENYAFRNTIQYDNIENPMNPGNINLGDINSSKLQGGIVCSAVMLEAPGVVTALCKYKDEEKWLYNKDEFANGRVVELTLDKIVIKKGEKLIEFNFYE